MFGGRGRGRGGGRGGRGGFGGASRKPAGDPNVHHLAKNISCHAWNGDRTRVALCPNNNEVHIFSFDGTKFQRQSVLKEHDQLVTSVDWAAQTNRLVTCSEDRNAYVWTEQTGQWKPTLVILRINRAATHVKWSPREDKFAVASGAKVVSVCYFEEEHDWWVSKHIKKHKSTVLHIDWHPNNLLLLSGSSDFKCRIFSAFIKGIDQRPKESVLAFGTRVPFGELLAELEMAQGWVHCCKWSPSGTKVVYVGHDSSITFADCSQNPPVEQKVKHKGLPFTSLLWLTEQTVIAAGHENAPFLIRNAGGWKVARKLDDVPKAAGAATKAVGGAASARSMWENKVDRGTNEWKGTTMNTKHQNCITQISMFKGAAGNPQSFTTSGVDGNLIVWNRAQLEQQLSGLSLV